MPGTNEALRTAANQVCQCRSGRNDIETIWKGDDFPWISIDLSIYRRGMRSRRPVVGGAKRLIDGLQGSPITVTSTYAVTASTGPSPLGYGVEYFAPGGRSAMR